MNIQFLTKETLKEELPCIIELYNTCFNRGLNENSFWWRYLDNPMNEVLFIVAKEKGKIIGSYSASPCQMRLGKEEFKTALSLNTMTHPSYQGKGLFVELAAQLYHYMQTKEYKMIWGFPNNLSNRTFNNKLNWKTIYEIPTLTLRLDNYTILSTTCKIVQDDTFRLDYQRLSDKVASKMRVKKIPDYLRWRYTNNPDNQYTVFSIEEMGKSLGYIVVKEYEDVLNIIDLDYEDFNCGVQMIEHSIRFAKQLNKRKVTIWAPTNTRIHSYLEKVGFYNDYPVRYLGGNVLTRETMFKELLQYDKWNLQLGDNNEY